MSFALALSAFSLPGSAFVVRWAAARVASALLKAQPMSECPLCPAFFKKTDTARREVGGGGPGGLALRPRHGDLIP